MNLKRRVLSASLWSLLGNGGHQLISFVLFIYLARKLSPADVGLLAFALVFVEILASLSRCGQVETLQRYVNLGDRITSTSFWILIVTGAVSCLSILIGGAALHSYPDYDTLGSVLICLAPLSALAAWNAVPEAILKQRLDFRSLTIRTWIATVVGGLLAIYLVHLDLGVYALVGQRLGTTGAQTIMLWTLLRWRPSFVFDRAEAKKLLGIGHHIMLAGLAGVINIRVTDSITGVFLGVHQLGFLKLGWRFFEAITQISVLPVSSVALSSFSKLRDRPENLRRAYLRLTQFMALASLPAVFGLGAVADVFVPVVFGEKWLPTVVVLELLGFLMLPGTINWFFAPFMMAVGATGVVLKQSIIQIFVSAVLVGIGAQWGLEGVVIGHVLRANLMSWYNLYAMNREVGLRPLLVFGALLPPTVACMVTVAVVLMLKHALIATISSLQLLAFLVLIGAVTYVVALLAGEALGFWRGYVGGAVQSLASAFRKPPSVPAGKDV
jgi:O-antigen/teichoic acid export membrane protein